MTEAPAPTRAQFRKHYRMGFQVTHQEKGMLRYVLKTGEVFELPEDVFFKYLTTDHEGLSPAQSLVMDELEETLPLHIRVIICVVAFAWVALLVYLGSFYTTAW